MKDEVITFGVLKKSQVEVLEFCKDPDGSGLLWFKLTGESVPVDKFQSFDTDREATNGRCFDTGEYYSQIGELLAKILRRAPTDATLATFTTSGGVGTRTFNEAVSVTFYS